MPLDYTNTVVSSPLLGWLSRFDPRSTSMPLQSRLEHRLRHREGSVGRETSGVKHRDQNIGIKTSQIKALAAKGSTDQRCIDAALIVRFAIPLNGADSLIEKFWNGGRMCLGASSIDLRPQTMAISLHWQSQKRQVPRTRCAGDPVGMRSMAICSTNLVHDHHKLGCSVLQMRANRRK